MDSEVKGQPAGDAGARSPSGERLRKLKSMVPAVSAVTVVVAALAATVMVTREHWQQANRPAILAKPGQDVVRAPPLVVKAPPINSKTLGAAPVCRDCGVVESVARVSPPGAYQMRVRMDDGTTRTVEQRGAVAAGSRVLIEGGSVRLMPPGTRQG